MKRLETFVAGSWRASAALGAMPFINPASAEVLAEVPLLPAEEIPAAAEAGLMDFAERGRRLAGESFERLPAQ
jgi:malonate-semialdehyde dehydrogenase (acetylating)/methylmalonate-semialdehyde dehydrogenase